MRSPVRLTLFGVEEANRVAQEIRADLVRLSRLRREYDRTCTRLEVQAVAAAGAAPGNPDLEELESLGGRRDRLGAEIRLAVEGIQRHGCVVKDMTMGLVDFYALRGDRLVHLCWHMGEPEVAHWHTLDGGFASRQPLDRSERE